MLHKRGGKRQPATPLSKPNARKRKRESEEGCIFTLFARVFSATAGCA